MNDRTDTRFLNPITQSFALLEKYKALLHTNLNNHGIPEEDIRRIMKDIVVEKNLLFSLNRKFREVARSFDQYCEDSRLSTQLQGLLTYGGRSLNLYVHQEMAIEAIRNEKHTIISTGTGSGKSEAFMIPILDHCLKNPGPGIKAIIIYPMNALANDQIDRIRGYTKGKGITYGCFTGLTSESEDKGWQDKMSVEHVVYRQDIRENPPDILITNNVMLDWILCRKRDRNILLRSGNSVKYLVLDEIHTYRGNKATHLRFLLKRLKAILNPNIIQIGASATLATRSGGDGYLNTANLDNFIKPLLDVSEYVFVEPSFEEEDEVEPLRIPEIPTTVDLGWELQSDTEPALGKMGSLMGKSYSPITDLAVSDHETSKLYQDLRRNEFIVEVKRLLLNEGAQSFHDFVRLMSRIMPVSGSEHEPETLVQAYLSAVSFVNHLFKSNPLLDFRIHLFLKNIGGHLKRCIKCQVYHSGRREYCDTCGLPLFMVYRHNINQCIGKIRDRVLNHQLKQESDDKKNSLFVLITEREATSSPTDNLSFNKEAEVVEDGLVLEYDKYGKLLLNFLPTKDYQGVESNLVSLTDSKKPYQYVYNVVASVLDFNVVGQRKVLGFIDNREKASHYALILKDEFVSRYLEELFIQFYDPDICDNLYSTQKYIEDQLEVSRENVEGDSDIVKVQQAFRLWYDRHIKMSPRKFEGKEDLLVFNGIEDLDEMERKVAKIFLDERALLGLPDCHIENEFITFHKYLVTKPLGIRIGGEDSAVHPAKRSNEGGKKAGAPRSIVLSESGRVYREFVLEHGMEKIKTSINRLHERGIILRRPNDDEDLYFLNAKYVSFNNERIRKAAIRDLKAACFRLADSHSSDRKGAQVRKEIEAKFKANRIHFLLATSTLEMGIDIGELQNILHVGVPPLPSNYAQRAGRAGRQIGGKYALVVTLCSDESSHDSYYFDNPKKMINGVISPPYFDPENINVKKKHINALLLCDQLAGDTTVNKLLADGFLEECAESCSAELRTIFGQETDYETYASTELKKHLGRHARTLSGRPKGLLKYFFEEGIFPDHSFSKSHIHLIATSKLRNGDQMPLDLTRFALSSRPVEEAIYKFSPKETMFIADRFYEIQGHGVFERIGEADGLPVLSFKYFGVADNTEHIGTDKIHNKYALSTEFENNLQFVGSKRLAKWAYSPSLSLSFLNKGKKLPDDSSERFQVEEGEFVLGYDISRESILLRFDGVCDEKTYLSFVSALDRAVKDEFGLDESEIRLLVGARPKASMRQDDPENYVIMYDFNGNGNVPFKRIFDEFQEVLTTTHDKLKHCRSENSIRDECDGCYSCLKSYGTHYLGSKIDRASALMLTGYLTGVNPFSPKVSGASTARASHIMRLEVRVKSRIVTVDVYIDGEKKKPCQSVLDGSQNKIIFDLLRGVIQAETPIESTELRVVSKLDYIVDAINKGSVNEDVDAFRLLQFNMLRFTRVEAMKGLLE